MGHDLATHISLLAAPIYAALIISARVTHTGEPNDADWRRAMRAVALNQARLLWDDALAVATR
jgi:hypothetical protein